MNELIKLFQVGPLSVTGYSLCLVLGTLLGAALTVGLGRRRIGIDASLSLCLAVLPGALLGARLLYCLTNIQYIQIDLESNFFRFLFSPWEGGFTLYGAILGGMAGLMLYAWATKRSAAALLNLTAPGAAVTLALARLGEYFTGQGLGKLVDVESLHFFPLAVKDMWEDWCMPVFVYEALAALVIATVTCWLLCRQKPAAEVFIVLLGVTQILFESWRMDEFIRFGFVRFNQIVSAILMAVVLGLRIARAVKQRGWSVWQIARIVLFLACAGVVVAIEFALDKSTIDNRLLYVIMAATLAIMGVSVLADRRVKG